MREIREFPDQEGGCGAEDFLLIEDAADEFAGWDDFGAERMICVEEF